MRLWVKSWLCIICRINSWVSSGDRMQMQLWSCWCKYCRYWCFIAVTFILVSTLLIVLSLSLPPHNCTWSFWSGLPMLCLHIMSRRYWFSLSFFDLTLVILFSIILLINATVALIQTHKSSLFCFSQIHYNLLQTSTNIKFLLKVLRSLTKPTIKSSYCWM